MVQNIGPHLKETEVPFVNNTQKTNKTVSHLTLAFVGLKLYMIIGTLKADFYELLHETDDCGGTS